VPVLSKLQISIEPHILTLLGLIVKIFFSFSLLIAKEIPIIKQVGRAGGTVIVTKSNNYKIMSSPINLMVLVLMLI